MKKKSFKQFLIEAPLGHIRPIGKADYSNFTKEDNKAFSRNILEKKLTILNKNCNFYLINDIDECINDEYKDNLDELFNNLYTYNEFNGFIPKDKFDKIFNKSTRNKVKHNPDDITILFIRLNIEEHVSSMTTFNLTKWGLIHDLFHVVNNYSNTDIDSDISKRIKDFTSFLIRGEYVNEDFIKMPTVIKTITMFKNTCRSFKDRSVTAGEEFIELATGYVYNGGKLLYSYEDFINQETLNDSDKMSIIHKRMNKFQYDFSKIVEKHVNTTSGIFISA